MVFEISAAKKQVLQELTQQAWTPTDLADELGKSSNTIYNHLEDLYDRGILHKEQVSAKTRPKTEYSIGDGFVQYVAILPGQYVERSLELTPEKQALIRVWNVPQPEFHPYVENFWWRLKHSADLRYREDIEALAIYGSVARGEADEESDIDFLVVTSDESSEETVAEQFGSTRIDAAGGAKIGMTEVYSMQEFEDSLAHGSDFLESIADELHVLYDPRSVLQHPGKVLANEQ